MRKFPVGAYELYTGKEVTGIRHHGFNINSLASSASFGFFLCYLLDPKTISYVVSPRLVTLSWFLGPARWAE